MTTTIHAELTAGHQQIVLMASGQVDVFDREQMDVALAARRLQTLTPLFSKSDPPGAVTVPATWPAVVQLAQTFGDAWAPGAALRAWINTETRSRTTRPIVTYTPPAELTPYPWQSEGAALIAATGRALITDEPGTGKTLTAILGLVEWWSTHELSGPTLVVCPASVVDPWVEAWRAWAPHLKTIAWRGSPQQRRSLYGAANVYVSSYETARADAGVMSGRGSGASSLRPLMDLADGRGPAGLVIDECHLVKNPHAERSKSVRRLAKRATDQGGAVVALSGTPITHHPGDLWSTLVALSPEAWPSRERWVNRYCETVTGDYREEILGLRPATEPEFRLTLLGQHRRVAKADVLHQLPPKVYSVRTVELPRQWRKVYDDFAEQMLAELPNGTTFSVMDIMSQFGHLSRLASAAADVEIAHGPDVDETTGELKRHVRLHLKAPSWKVDALLEVLAERQNGTREPVVVFAPSRQLIMLAGAAAAAAGLKVGYIVGGQSMTERTVAVESFQSGALDLICATTGAGGVGITLTAARTVVFLQRPWSLVEAIQAEDRCHRIGSERHDSIEIVDVVARNTLDTRIRAVLRERAGQLAALVQDPRIVADLLGGTRTTAARDTSPVPSSISTADGPTDRT